MTPDWHRQGGMALEYSHFPNSHYTKKLMNDYLVFILKTDVTHRLNNGVYSKDVAPRMGFVIPLTLQIMVVD